MKGDSIITFRLDTTTIIRILGALIGFCIFMALVRGGAMYINSNLTGDGLWMKFNMDNETTLPAYISSINLLIASALLALVCKLKERVADKYWKHWGLLSIGFLLLSIDENISLHEVIVHDYIMQLLEFSGPNHFVTGVLITACAALSSAFFLKFLFHLPTTTRMRIITSGVIFVLGSAGVEAITGYLIADGYQSQKIAYNIGVIVEEAMEMTSVLLFIRAILSYIQENLFDIISLFNIKAEVLVKEQLPIEA
ncbi:hypothetical protein ACFS7Z_09805 [Pontibacter toksunensis]|uniref:Multidrug transporter n=1 Tax=Pontibacter toksunensis TaxID=1332631 RepID=A0ABW6BS35_9BACT